jgi:hypothetical protein
MSVSNVTSTPLAGVRMRKQNKGAAVRPMRSIVSRWSRHRSLIAWNWNLMRPACCAHLPSRVWYRHSAILTLRAGGSLK